MKEKVITDNAGERITILGDGERFSIVLKKQIDSSHGFNYTTGYSVIILNRAEMLDVIEFAAEYGISAEPFGG